GQIHLFPVGCRGCWNRACGAANHWVTATLDNVAARWRSSLLGGQFLLRLPPRELRQFGDVFKHGDSSARIGTHPNQPPDPELTQIAINTVVKATNSHSNKANTYGLPSRLGECVGRE